MRNRDIIELCKCKHCGEFKGIFAVEYPGSPYQFCGEYCAKEWKRKQAAEQSCVTPTLQTTRYLPLSHRTYGSSIEQSCKVG